MRIHLRFGVLIGLTLACSLLRATAAEDHGGKLESQTPVVQSGVQQGKRSTNGLANFPFFMAHTNHLGGQNNRQQTNGNAVGMGGTAMAAGSPTNSRPTNPGAASGAVGGKPTGTTATLQSFSALSASAPILAHWKFDETTGTTATDYSGNNLHGTLSTSGASFVAGGMSGNALQLTRAANGYVNMGNVLGLTSGSFSMAVWVKMNAGDTTDSSFIVTKHTGGYATDVNLGNDVTGSAALVSGYCNDLAPGSGNIVLNYMVPRCSQWNQN